MRFSIPPTRKLAREAFIADQEDPGTPAHAIASFSAAPIGFTNDVKEAAAWPMSTPPFTANVRRP